MGRDKELEQRIEQLEAAVHVLIATLQSASPMAAWMRDPVGDVNPALEPFVTRRDVRGQVTRKGVGDR